MTTATAAKYHRFRPPGAAATGEEAGPEIAEAGCTAGADGATADAPDDAGMSTGSATLTDELLPESISRFNRFRSPRISEAT